MLRGEDTYEQVPTKRDQSAHGYKKGLTGFDTNYFAKLRGIVLAQEKKVVDDVGERGSKICHS